MTTSHIDLPDLPVRYVSQLLPDRVWSRSCAAHISKKLRFLALASTFLLPTLAYSQSVENAENNFDPVQQLLRGTTGNGLSASDQEDPVFTDELLNAEPVAEAASVAPRAPLQRQTQGRTLPVQAEPQVLDPINVATPSARSNLRAAKVQDGISRRAEIDEFTQEGFRIGSWRAFASVEQTLGYSTNLGQTIVPTPSAFSQTDVNFSLQSDWARHQASINASGVYRKSLGNDLEDFPTLAINSALRLDLIDGLAGNFDAGYGFTTESATGTILGGSVTGRPGVHSYNAGAGLERTDRKLNFSLRGSVGRTTYEDADLSIGGTVSQEDRNNNLYLLVARLGYEITPAMTPFVEVQTGLRRFDLSKDRNGDRRNSNINAASVGVAFDLGEKLSGEVSGGYQVENFEDGGLDNLSGFIFNGNIVWSPVRDTNVTLTSRTSFNGSITAGQNGGIVQDFDLALSRQVNDRLSLTGVTGVQITRQDDNSRTDFDWSIGAGMRYWLNRYMALTGNLDHQVRTSTDPLAEYSSTTVRAGVRFQH